LLLIAAFCVVQCLYQPLEPSDSGINAAIDAATLGFTIAFTLEIVIKCVAFAFLFGDEASSDGCLMRWARTLCCMRPPDPDAPAAAAGKEGTSCGAAAAEHAQQSSSASSADCEGEQPVGADGGPVVQPAAAQHPPFLADGEWQRLGRCGMPV